MSPAQRELQEAVKRSAERRRHPPNLSVRISPSPHAPARGREKGYALSLGSTYGMLSDRMADRSTPRSLGRQSLSSVMAQATAQELERIRAEEGAMHAVCPNLCRDACC